MSERSSGLWLAPCGLIGGSPDGVVSETKLIEVKCPYSARSTSLAAMAKEKTFFLSVSSSSPANLSLDLSTESGWNYFHQIQGNLCLTGREVCDLVAWTPLETVIIPIWADPTWSGNLARIEEFYKTFFLPVFLADADGTVADGAAADADCTLADGAAADADGAGALANGSAADRTANN